MSPAEQWITVDDIASARRRFIDALPGWRAPVAHAVGFVAEEVTGIGPEHFPLVNTAEHLLPAAVLATVVGHRAGTAVYELSRGQLDEAIALLEPAEACADYEHPNLWRWRDEIRAAWEQDPRARVIAVFIDEEASESDGHPAVVAVRAAAAGRPLTLRERLRALPVFDAAFPPFDPAAAPDDPVTLFGRWLDDAVTGGVRVPHATTLSTASAGGDVTARTVILKDLDARGWWFASRTDGRKHRDLTTNPRAAMTFFWREQARQVRVSGVVSDAGRPTSDADFLARPRPSRAGALVGKQSAPLISPAEYARALAAAAAEIAADPLRTSDTWAASILQPLVVEFWAATPDTGQVRLEYRREDLAGSWRRDLLWP